MSSQRPKTCLVRFQSSSFVIKCLLEMTKVYENGAGPQDRKLTMICLKFKKRLDLNRRKHPGRLNADSESHVVELTGSKPDHAEVLKNPDIDRYHLQKKVSHTKS
ncbi:hypothetical protein PoB_001942200 [Plakobranchus ocellatus]|uniref:Uncharacterized protein n=1 Tax=Plakobranchus ocellatus TaxID=259542 RepID=A0AAV3ZEF5_9GAST|nr:hypothetical protein PoB_001942200 [Plakobranchus ocellatus]